MSPGDPGLQPQRTALAWSRTAIALFVVAVLSIRGGVERDDRLGSLVGIVLLLAAAGGLSCAHWRRSRLVALQGLEAPPRWLMAATLVAALVAVANGLASFVDHLA